MMSAFRSVAIVLCALVLCSGCAHKRKPSVASAGPEKPWIGTKSLCIFPMARGSTSATAQPEALAAAMTAGWKARLEVPAGAELVRIQPGPHPGRLSSMSIDLTDVRVEAEGKQNRLKPLRGSQGSVAVDHLELIANPLLVEKAHLLIGLTATDAKLDVRRDKQGRSMLTLTDAKDGTMTLEVPRKDVDWLLLHGARELASKFGVAVDRTKLKLDVEDNRTIRLDLKIDTRVALLPAGFRFKARVDIDDDLNGKMTHLSCEGDQLLGPLISSIINPMLEKYEGRTRPLVGFEWGEMKLRDVKMDTTDSFRLEAKFGSVPGANKPVVVQRKSRKRAA
jgi:hypothetical protein